MSFTESLRRSKLRNLSVNRLSKGAEFLGVHCSKKFRFLAVEGNLGVIWAAEAIVISYRAARLFKRAHRISLRRLRIKLPAAATGGSRTRSCPGKIDL